MTHFGPVEGAIGPLEAIFRHLDFKPLVFGTFVESNTNVKEFIDTAVKYGAEHMGRLEVPDSARDGSVEGICKLGLG